MDGDERRHHQYGPPQGYAVPNPGPANPAQRMRPPPPAGERYAQPPARVDTSRSMLSRSQASGYSGYGFPEQQYSSSPLQGGPMQGVEMQYSPSYANDPSRAQPLQQQTQQQQYTPYGQSVMMQPTPPQSVYESVPQFQQRQTAAIEVLTDRFGNPSYLPSTVQGGMGPPQYMTSPPEQVSFQQHVPRSRSVTGQSDPQQSSVMSIHDHHYPEESQAATSAADALEEEKQKYQQQLRMTFEAIRVGKVSEASEKLTQISYWLLSSVVALGLHHDEPDKYAARIGLWREFNLCWEALGLKQKDISEEALRSGRQPPDMLTAKQLQAMVEDLISLCDNIEQHGLVDYDMGVWEEQILHVFTQCLDLFPPHQSATETT